MRILDLLLGRRIENLSPPLINHPQNRVLMNEAMSNPKGKAMITFAQRGRPGAETFIFNGKIYKSYNGNAMAGHPQDLAGIVLPMDYEYPDRARLIGSSVEASREIAIMFDLYHEVAHKLITYLSVNQQIPESMLKLFHNYRRIIQLHNTGLDDFKTDLDFYLEHERYWANQAERDLQVNGEMVMKQGGARTIEYIVDLIALFAVNEVVFDKYLGVLVSGTDRSGIRITTEVASQIREAVGDFFRVIGYHN